MLFLDIKFVPIFHMNKFYTSSNSFGTYLLECLAQFLLKKSPELKLRSDILDILKF